MNNRNSLILGASIIIVAILLIAAAAYGYARLLSPDAETSPTPTSFYTPSTVQPSTTNLPTPSPAPTATVTFPAS